MQAVDSFRTGNVTHGAELGSMLTRRAGTLVNTKEVFGSAMRSAAAVLPSCFAVTFELHCAVDDVHWATHGITHAYILNTYCPAWRAVHMLLIAVYAKTNFTLRLHPSVRTPYGTNYSM